jgi:hypothetical protein
MKKCYKCKIEKPFDKFCKNKKHKDGLNELCKDCKKEYNLKNSETNKEYYKLNRNPEKHKLYSSKFRENNPNYQKEWYSNNKDKYKEYAMNYKSRYPHINRWRQILNDTLIALEQKKISNTRTLLNYSAQDLKQHLDNQGMVWGSYEVDHKIPISWFESFTPPHIVNDLRNLHPLPSIENKRKLNRFCSPIEESYIKDIKEYIKKEYSNEITWL